MKSRVKLIYHGVQLFYRLSYSTANERNSNIPIYAKKWAEWGVLAVQAFMHVQFPSLGNHERNGIIVRMTNQS